VGEQEFSELIRSARKIALEGGSDPALRDSAKEFLTRLFDAYGYGESHGAQEDDAPT
jgi:hypothetical protein